MDNVKRDDDYSFYSSSAWRSELCYARFLQEDEDISYDDFMAMCTNTTALPDNEAGENAWLANLKTWIAGFVAAGNTTAAIQAAREYLTVTNTTDKALEVTESILTAVHEASHTHFVPTIPTDHGNNTDTTTELTTIDPVPANKDESSWMPWVITGSVVSWVVIPVAIFAIRKIRGIEKLLSLSSITNFVLRYYLFKKLSRVTIILQAMTYVQIVWIGGI